MYNKIGVTKETRIDGKGIDEMIFTHMKARQETYMVNENENTETRTMIKVLN